MTTNFAAFEKARIHEGCNTPTQAGVRIPAKGNAPALIRVGSSYFNADAAAAGRIVRVRK